MKAKGVISEVLNVQTYISPYSRPWNERVEDEDIAVEDLVDDIAARHAPEKENDNDDEQLLDIRPPVGHNTALLALNTLREYEEQNEQSDGVLLRHLRAYEKEISIKKRESQKQVQLDSWFTGTSSRELSE
jgi:hypothetical protein